MYLRSAHTTPHPTRLQTILQLETATHCQQHNPKLRHHSKQSDSFSLSGHCQDVTTHHTTKTHDSTQQDFNLEITYTSEFQKHDPGCRHASVEYLVTPRYHPPIHSIYAQYHRTLPNHIYCPIHQTHHSNNLFVHGVSNKDNVQLCAICRRQRMETHRELEEEVIL